MNYNIKGTNLAISPELRSYVEQRLAHADRFIDSTAHADVELEYSTRNETGKYRAEMTLSMDKDVYRAERWGSAMHEAIDLMVEEMVGELRRKKTQKLKVFRRTAVRVKEFLRGWRRDV